MITNDEADYLHRLAHLIADDLRLADEYVAEGLDKQAAIFLRQMESDMEEYLLAVSMIRSREATKEWTEAADKAWGSAIDADFEL